MSRHLFTSDLHLGHPKVAGIRGYVQPVLHDINILSTLERSVGDGDVLWILGDLVGSAREWDRGLRLVGDLPGRKRLVLGNHDPAHPMSRSAFKHTPALAEVFEWWGTSARTKVCGHDVLLSHFPYTRDRGEPRHTQWRLRNEGAWLLHGHTHGQERVTLGPHPSWTDTLHGHQRSREIHVGWDAWGRPVADHEIATLLTKETA